MNKNSTSDRISVPKELYALRPYRWLADVCLDWLVIAGTFVAFSCFKAWYLVPVAGLVIGARIHALGLLAHDGAHRLAFRNTKVNDLLTEVLTAWPLFAVIDKGYRPWHFDHHKLLGTDRDPELHDYRGFEPYEGKVTWGKIWRYFIYDLFGFGIGGLFKFLRAIFPYKQPWRMIGPLCLWSLFLGVTIYYDAVWVFFLWLWSLVAGFWAVFRIRTWTEHVGVEPSGKDSSHRFITGPVCRFLFFPHNTFCHYEHHKWPQVPYYNLPELRKFDKARPVLQMKDLFPAG
jgi:fatty acid desaturase